MYRILLTVLVNDINFWFLPKISFIISLLIAVRGLLKLNLFIIVNYIYLNLD
ncbi:unnamed protein product [Meloidogyne enterolobii]|uniref:Uncharacterized protein n=1 Tax=Meloidogyne enterolobii TaxID=390850 RepID=A0ACB0YZV0_MELEN